MDHDVPGIDDYNDDDLEPCSSHNIVAPALKRLWDSRRIWSRAESDHEIEPKRVALRRIERRLLTTGILINPESLFSSGLLTKQTPYDRLYLFTNKPELFRKAVSLSRERRGTTRVQE